MLGVNMQTSFMHPPFGFALFYLRSVAAKEPYKDRVTGKMTDPVTTGQIYWGAVPFVIIQCIMVGLVIALPADGDALQGVCAGRRSEHDRDPHPVIRRAAGSSGRAEHSGAAWSDAAVQISLLHLNRVHAAGVDIALRTASRPGPVVTRSDASSST